MSWQRHLLILGLTFGLGILITALTILSPCKGGGLDLLGIFCGVGKGFVVISILLFLINLFLISTIILAINRHRKRLNLLFVYLISFLISLLLIPGEFFVWYSVAKYDALVIQPNRVEGNYQIIDFSEKLAIKDPITGKYKGIQMTLTMGVKKEGLYTLIPLIEDSNRKPLFRAKRTYPQTHNIAFNSETPQQLTFIFEPQDELRLVKFNGPYHISLRVWRVSGLPQGSRGIDLSDTTPAFKAYITSKHNYKPWDWENAVIVFDDKLITGSYRYTDFIYP